MRPAKILLRLKGDRSQVKAFVNVRDRDKSHPRQLHLGYLHIHQDLETVKSRLFRALVDKWPRNQKPREIDWQDAETKLSKLKLVYLERMRQLEGEPLKGARLDSHVAISSESSLEPAAVEASLPGPSISSPEVATSSQSTLRPPWEAELAELLPQLTIVARRWTKNRAEADDLVQATLESALRSGFVGNHLKGWLFGIMRHRFFDALRFESRAANRVDLDEIADLLMAHEEEPEEPWQKLTWDDLYKLLTAIDMPYRDVFILVYIDRRSYHEVANILRIPANTVSSRLARARQKIRQLVRERVRS